MSYEQPDYPFGFGFAFMRNRRAIDVFHAMSEREQKKLVRRLTELRTQGEREAWIEELEKGGKS